MGFFSPHKRHPEQFKYTPRYFDPVKEAMNARRKELSGMDSDMTDQEYKPGQYIRTKRDARMAKRTAGKPMRRSGISTMVIAGVLVIVMLIYMIYPRVVEAFSTAHQQTSSSSLTEMQQAELDAFNPYAPITVVPNDYKEE